MTNTIKYDKDMFFTGEPVYVDDIGDFRFLTYKEYLLLQQQLGLMNMNVLHVYHQYRKIIDTSDSETEEALEELKAEKLIDIVLSQETFAQSYAEVFSIVLMIEENKTRNETITKIFSDEELFMSVRRLVLDMQMLVESEVNPNPEIQEGIDMSRELKSQNAESMKPLDIVSSIVAATANSFEEVCNMTVIQINSILYRIGAFKSYDTSILFATVSPDVEIESWGKSIDLYETETSGIKKKDFDSKFGGLF